MKISQTNHKSKWDRETLKLKRVRSDKEGTLFQKPKWDGERGFYHSFPLFFSFLPLPQQAPFSHSLSFVVDMEDEEGHGQGSQRRQ